MRNLLSTIKKRQDFVFLSKNGKKVVSKSMILLFHRCFIDSDKDNIMVGYTVSKKIGKAVKRNLVKRRFRAASSNIIEKYGVKGSAYLLIARTGSHSFNQIIEDLEKSLRKVSSE